MIKLSQVRRKRIEFELGDGRVEVLEGTLLGIMFIEERLKKPFLEWLGGLKTKSVVVDGVSKESVEFPRMAEAAAIVFGARTASYPLGADLDRAFSEWVSDPTSSGRHIMALVFGALEAFTTFLGCDLDQDVMPRPPEGDAAPPQTSA